MRSLIIAAAICSTYCASFGQANQFMTIANGRPLVISSNIKVQGTPFFNKEYQLADITATSGVTYKGIKVKINLAENQLYYLTNQKEELVTIVPIVKVRFPVFTDNETTRENIVLTSFPGAFNTAGAPIYEVLDSGKCSLLKKILVSYTEEKKFGDADITRTYDHIESYYAMLPNGQLKKLEKGKSAMLELFPDKKDKVEAFISQGKLSCKGEKDYIAVFRFYNTL